MITLSGEFITIENAVSKANVVNNYVKILDVENSDVKSVKVKDPKKYLNIEPRTPIEMIVNVNSFKDRLYWQEV